MAFVQATTGFHTNYGGEDIVVQAGEVFDASHEIVRRTPDDWWIPLYVRYGEVAPEEATTNRKRTTKTTKAASKDAADD